MIKIETTNNGAVIKTCEGKEAFIFDNDDMDGLVDLLYRITEILVIRNNYSEKTIYITTAHGRKYDCNKKKCVLCERLNAIYEEEK